MKNQDQKRREAAARMLAGECIVLRTIQADLKALEGSPSNSERIKEQLVSYEAIWKHVLRNFNALPLTQAEKAEIVRDFLRTHPDIKNRDLLHYPSK